MRLNIERNILSARRSESGGLAAILLDAKESSLARQAISNWPFYRCTPLEELPGLAEKIDIAKIYAKNESKREPLKSFKMLGAVYALAAAVREQGFYDGRLEQIFDGTRQAETPQSTNKNFKVVAATDGNHGTALAWASQILGVGCAIYLPAGVSQGRERTIADYGATIVRIEGSYDDAVSRAYGDALRNGWTIIQDTAPAGFQQHCRNIMHGYTLLIDEACRQLEPMRPSHVFVQAGVGGFAAAVGSYLWHRYGEEGPALITVESDQADCVFQSLKAGSRVAIPGPHNTMMGGIACGEVSEVAWPILRQLADFAITIDDDWARRALQVCSSGLPGDPALEIGETGIAGLAALLAIGGDKEAAAALAMDDESVALAFVTEGITDPETYRVFVGSGLGKS